MQMVVSMGHFPMGFYEIAYRGINQSARTRSCDAPLFLRPRQLKFTWGGSLDPDALKAWQSIFRDVVITILASFMLVYETVFAASRTRTSSAPASPCSASRPRCASTAPGGATADDDPYDGPGGYFKR
jgi:hypothetical protein